MKPGTPGFVGERLREAREARGLTAISLADLLGISRQAVSQFENGNGSPSPDTMRKIAATLNLPPRFFLRPVEDRQTGAVFYRSMSAATKTARARGMRRSRWLQDIVAYLQGFVELPPVNLPDIDLPEDPSALSEHDIENVASQTRRFWRLGDGSISNVVWLLENNGVVVTRDELGAETLDAFTGWDEGSPYIVLGADKGSAARSRLDAAHELGHLVLHRHIDQTRLRRAQDFRVIEDQAFRFAGAFLLPDTTFSRDFYVPTLDALLAVKPKWGVSVGMMLHRAADLELIPPEQARRLWISYNRRGWKRREPLDDELPIEQPRLLRKSFELMIGEGVQTRSEVSAYLPFAATDIEDLAGLPERYLDEPPPVIRLRDRQATRSKNLPGATDEVGSLVQFPGAAGSAEPL